MAELNDHVVAGLDLGDESVPEAFTGVGTCGTAATGEVDNGERHVVCEWSTPSRRTSQSQNSRKQIG